jgi:hypothetical protein
MTQPSKKLKVLLISALLVSGFATGPVQAHQIDNVLAPLAAFVVLGSLLRHNHGQEYYYKRRPGHYGHNRGYNGHYGHQHGHQARSYSYEGYNRKSRRNSRQARSYRYEGYNRKPKRINRH